MFVHWAAASGLSLSVGKCVIVPFWTYDADEVTD